MFRHEIEEKKRFEAYVNQYNHLVDYYNVDDKTRIPYFRDYNTPGFNIQPNFNVLLSLNQVLIDYMDKVEQSDEEVIVIELQNKLEMYIKDRIKNGT